MLRRSPRRACGLFLRASLGLVVVAALLEAPARAGDLALDVQERTLDNGLKVLVLEDHDIPNAVLYTTWRVGSRNEAPGTTGIAHFFEHMMFTGGRRYGVRFDPTMESAGGSNNAYTSNDVTAYQDWFPSAALPLIIDMEADRMSGMVFRERVVKTERGVVASERRLAMDDPNDQMSEELWAAAYTAHPYQWPVLGWMVDIQNWKLSDLEEFFDRHYAPNNATMVIVGDVEPDAVFKLVQEKLGGLVAKPERRPIHTKEPEQRGERRVDLEHESASLPAVMCAWHIPETGHPDFAVLDVLEKLLLGGDSSRLQRLLVEGAEVCLGVGGGWQGYQFDPSLFSIDLQMRDGVATAQAEELLYEELARIAADGPAERELRKVKNGIRARFIAQLATIDGKASMLSETETFFGGWRNLQGRLDSIEAVTAADVQRVVTTYFTQRNRTVVTLVVAADGTSAGEDSGAVEEPGSGGEDQ